MRGKITKRSVDGLVAARGEFFLWDTDLAGFGVKVTPSGKRVYVLQYRARNQARKEFSAPKRLTLGRHGELTPEQARALAAKLLLEVKSGGDPGAQFRSTESPTVALLADRFMTEYLPGKKRPPRPSTVRYYGMLFRVHVVPTLGIKRVDAVTTEDVEKLHLGMRDTPYMANRVLFLLQHAFGQAERWGWRPQNTNPALHVERYREERRGSQKDVMLDSSQMAKLLSAIDAEEDAGRVSTVAAAALRTTFWTGWRISEVLKLRWENVDLARGVAKLVGTKTAVEEHRQLPSEAVEILQRMSGMPGSAYVFPGAAVGSHLTTIRRPWLRIRKRAELDQLDGLGAFRVHDLRHNVVSWDVSRGVPLEIAGKNVGHRSRRSTEVYAHFAPDALKRAADERAAAMRRAVEETGVETPRRSLQSED